MTAKLQMQRLICIAGSDAATCLQKPNHGSVSK